MPAADGADTYTKTSCINMGKVFLVEIRLNVPFESDLCCFLASVHWLCRSIAPAPALACFHLAGGFSS